MGRKKKVLPSNVLSVPLVGKNFGHPAVYPVGLPSFFIKLLTPNNGVVVDPFGGSGQTAIAALQLGRRSILVDNNKHYCTIAAGRVQKAAKEISATISLRNFGVIARQVKLHMPSEKLELALV
ncbi:MAG: hypothetical protein COT00_02160 [Candidatus Omnitrophica bacterium CG07_land_8_20_14_0_80_50_8]|nr:MAG: hypothetical protein COT00_02160 [Candidatus Omnitrophica bacterium CG07_land_8_20_14_0_80_50_8]